jgi:hypothetical protein
MQLCRGRTQISDVIKLSNLLATALTFTTTEKPDGRCQCVYYAPFSIIKLITDRAVMKTWKMSHWDAISRIEEAELHPHSSYSSFRS